MLPSVRVFRLWIVMSHIYLGYRVGSRRRTRGAPLPPSPGRRSRDIWSIVEVSQKGCRARSPAAADLASARHRTLFEQVENWRSVAMRNSAIDFRRSQNLWGLTILIFRDGGVAPSAANFSTTRQWQRKGPKISVFFAHQWIADHGAVRLAARCAGMQRRAQTGGAEPSGARRQWPPPGLGRALAGSDPELHVPDLGGACRDNRQ